LDLITKLVNVYDVEATVMSVGMQIIAEYVQEAVEWVMIMKLEL
jgi:hypothetical protein